VDRNGADGVLHDRARPLAEARHRRGSEEGKGLSPSPQVGLAARERVEVDLLRLEVEVERGAAIAPPAVLGDRKPHAAEGTRVTDHRPAPASSSATASAAAAGSGAEVMGRPITRRSAPRATASAGVATRA